MDERTSFVLISMLFFVNLFALKNSQSKKVRYLDTALVLSFGMADPRNWNVKKSCAG